MRRRAALLLAALALGGASPTPTAPAVSAAPTEAAYTRAMADRFRAALPGYEVTITEALTLAIRRPGGQGESYQVFLGRMSRRARIS